MLRKYAGAEITSQTLIALLLLAIEFGLLLLSTVAGPYVPLLVFHIVLIYVALNVGTRLTGYAIAIVAAIGRTWIHSSVLPETSFALLFAWHLFNNATVLLLICHLLDRTHRPAAVSMQDLGSTDSVAKKAGWTRLFRPGRRSTSRARSIGPAFAMVLLLPGYSVSLNVDGNSTPTVSRASAVEDNEFDNDRIVMLTIDDGPRDPRVDARLLGILQSHAAKSVWFVNCANFDGNKYANMAMLTKIRDLGHVIGNHSYEHLDLIEVEQKDPERMKWQVDQCSDAIGSSTGERPRYFRAPFGRVDAAVMETSNQAGMSYMGWSVSFDVLFGFHRRDDQVPTPVEVQQLAESIDSGDIVLFHDNERTAQVMDEFLTALERRGFRFVLPSDSPAPGWGLLTHS